MSAYPRGEYVEQESFMRGSEILAMAHHAGVAPGIAVLDLCCGVTGPGRLITAELGCCYLRVDLSSSAIDIAGELSLSLRSLAHTAGAFGAVQRGAPLRDHACVSRQGDAASGGIGGDGSRRALRFTLEEGLPLTEAERGRMPDSDTVWLTPLPEMLAYRSRPGSSSAGRTTAAGLTVPWRSR